MRRRLFIVLSFVLLGFLLVACDETNYKVTFDVAGGTPAIASQTIKDGGLVTKPANPKKDGFTFKFWQEKESAEEWVFASDKVTKNITLVAQWEEAPPEVEKVKVTFDVKGGTPTVPIQTIDKGEKATKPTDPTKEGYDFLGWYKGEAEYDFNTAVNEDITLEAKWEEQELAYTYTLEFSVTAPEGTEGDVYVIGTFIKWDLTKIVKLTKDSAGNYEGSYVVKSNEAIAEIEYKYFNSASWDDPEGDENYDYRDDRVHQMVEGINQISDVILSWETEQKPEKIAKPILEYDETNKVISWEAVENALEYEVYIRLEQNHFKVATTNETSFDPLLVSEGLEGSNYFYVIAIAKQGHLNSDNSEEVLFDVPYLTKSLLVGNTFTQVAFVTAENYFARRNATDASAPSNILYAISGVKEYLASGKTINEAFSTVALLDEDYQVTFVRNILAKQTYTAEEGWFVDEAYESNNAQLVELDDYLNEGDYLIIGKNQKNVTFKVDGEEKTAQAREFLAYHVVNTWESFPNPAEAPANGWRAPMGEFVDAKAIIFAFDADEPAKAFAYIEDVGYPSIADAITAAAEGDTILLIAGEHEESFTVDKNDLSFAPVAGKVAVLKGVVSLVDDLKGVKFEGLEFTGDAYIHAPGKIDDFVFINNKVYGTTLAKSEYKPRNLTDVNAFIRLFHAPAVNDIVGNVTIKDNEFTNISSDIISIARTAVDKEILIEGNLFHNFPNSAIRFDGNRNNATHNVFDNVFKQDVAGENINAIAFVFYAPTSGNKQVINIVGNEFINVGNDSMDFESESGHPGSGTIVFAVFNDQPVELNINDNVFRNVTRAIHFRNAGAKALIDADLTGNVFENVSDYYLYQARPGTYPAPEADFNDNMFIDEEGEIITDLAVIGAKIINNVSYERLQDLVRVTFDLAYPEAPSAEVVYIKENETVKKPKDPERFGWLFAGWFLAEEEFEFTTELTEDTTLTAHWTYNMLEAPEIELTEELIGWEAVVGAISYDVYLEVAGQSFKVATIDEVSFDPLAVSRGLEGSNYYYVIAIGDEKISEASNKVSFNVPYVTKRFAVEDVVAEVAIVTAENYFARRNATDATKLGNYLYLVTGLYEHLEAEKPATEAFSVVALLDEDYKVTFVRNIFAKQTYTAADGWFEDDDYANNDAQLVKIDEHIKQGDYLLIGKNALTAAITFAGEEETVDARELLAYILVNPWDDFPAAAVAPKGWRAPMTEFIDAKEVIVVVGDEPIPDEPFEFDDPVFYINESYIDTTVNDIDAFYNAGPGANMRLDTYQKSAFVYDYATLIAALDDEAVKTSNAANGSYPLLSNGLVAVFDENWNLVVARAATGIDESAYEIYGDGTFRAQDGSFTWNATHANSPEVNGLIKNLGIITPPGGYVAIFPYQGVGDIRKFGFVNFYNSEYTGGHLSSDPEAGSNYYGYDEAYYSTVVFGVKERPAE